MTIAGLTGVMDIKLMKAGIEIFFSSATLVGKALDIWRGLGVSASEEKTHPSPEFRRASLAEATELEYGENGRRSFTLANLVQMICEDLWSGEKQFFVARRNAGVLPYKLWSGAF